MAQYQAMLSMVRYWVTQLCSVKLNEETGLGLLLKRVEEFLNSSPSPHDVTGDNKETIALFHLIHHCLETLWSNRAEFKTQLKSMNTGSIDYSRGGNEGTNMRNFKDFGFEIVSASLLVDNGIHIALPENTKENDIFYTGGPKIEIQCKHPEVLSKERLKEFLVNAIDHASAKDPESKVILGLAVDGIFPYEKRGDDASVVANRQQIEDALNSVFSDVKFPSALVGIYTLSTRFDGEVIRVDGNSILLNHVGITRRNDELMAHTYRILQSFNPTPSTLRVENSVFIKFNSTSWT